MSLIGKILDRLSDRFIDRLLDRAQRRTLHPNALLLQDAQIVLLDEPFNAIDTKTVSDLLALVKHWHGERRTIVTVLHDMEHVRRHFPDTLLLARQMIAHGPTGEVLTAENLFRARQACETFDDHAAVCHLPPQRPPQRAA